MIIEWLQMDKAGHIYSSYHLGRLGLKCSNGVELSKEQLIFGSGMGFAFLTAVEVLDGFSSEWGASRRYNCKCFGYCFICLPGITMEATDHTKFSFIPRNTPSTDPMF
jgi:hypothetical protein